MRKVAKFGGTSVADAEQIKKVLAIVRADPERKCIVVSAPGKRHPDDHKVTDLLYQWYSLLKLDAGKPATDIRALIRERYASIAEGLGVSFDINAELDTIERSMAVYLTPDFTASRGEYLNAKIISKAIGFEFVDASRFIRFGENGQYDKSETFSACRKVLGGTGYYVLLPLFENTRTKRPC